MSDWLSHPRRAAGPVLLRGLRCLVFALSGVAQTVAAPRPNIVYIQADDLGWADLGCYGHPFHRTPAIDRLAKEGTRFTHAYSASPSCTPSRAGLLTGQHPARLHMTGQASYYADAPVRRLLHPRTRLELPEEIPTVARSLAQAGYDCVSFGKWGLGQRTAGHGFSRVENAPDEQLTRMAVDFIREKRNGPFLLYLNYHWPHSPLKSNPTVAADVRARLRSAGGNWNPDYAATLEQIDAAVAEVVSALEQAGQAGATLVIFTSDNGGFLGRDNEPYTSNAPLREGKSSLYEGGIRVPFIVRWPGVTPAGAVTGAPIGNLDFCPTLCRLLGLPCPAAGGLDGTDRSALFRGEPAAPMRDMHWHFPHYRRAMASRGASPASAVRSGDWKLIHFYEDDQMELYNLREDPFERTNLAAIHPEATARLRRKLDDWRRAVNAQPPEPNPLYQFAGF